MQTYAITGSAKLRAMRLVAITTGHASGKHLALLEDAIIVNLIAHLPIGIVQAAGERTNDMGVRKRSSRYPILGKFAAAGVTKAACLDFLASERRSEIALRVARRGSWCQTISWRSSKRTSRPFVRSFCLCERPPTLLITSPVNMPRTLAVTRLTADADLGPGGGKAVVVAS